MTEKLKLVPSAPALEGTVMRRGGEKDPVALAAYIGRKRAARLKLPGLSAKQK